MTPSTAKKPDPKASNSVGLGILFRGMSRYPLITFSFVLLAGAAGAAVWFYLPLPKMTGRATFHIKDQADYLVNPLNFGDAKVAFNVYKTTQSALIKARNVLREAVKEPEIKSLDTRGWKPDEVTWLEQQLKVDFKLGPEFMCVSIEGNDEDTLKKIISAIVTTYMKEVEGHDIAKKRKKIKLLEDYRAQLQEEIEGIRKRMELAEAVATTNPQAFAEGEKYIQERIGKANDILENIAREILDFTAESDAQEKKLKNTKTIPFTKDEIRAKASADPKYQRLVEERKAFYDLLQANRDAVGSNGPKPAKIVQQEEHLQKLDDGIETYVESIKPQIVEQLRVEREAIVLHRKTELEGLIEIKKGLEKAHRERLEKLLADAEKKKKAQFALERDAANLKHTVNLADNLTLQIETLKPEIQNPSSRVEVWEQPTVVPGIEGNRRLKYSAMAFGAMLFCGIGLVSWLEYRNRRILHVNEVTAELGLRFVGSVPELPKQALRSRNPVLNDELLGWQVHLTETIDNTRTMLLHGSENEKPIRTIMITSALSGEGKTSLSGHLAVSLARGGYKTLLIDADIRRPSLHKVFNAGITPGLSELLRFQADVKSVVRETQIPGLSMISAGDWHNAWPSMLAGDRFADLKKEFEEEFDYIIVDSPPLLPVADSLMLARHMDGVLLSLLRDVSQLQAVSEAKDRLTNVGTNILGVVMNGMRHDLFQYSPYYYRRPSKGSITNSKI